MSQIRQTNFRSIFVDLKDTLLKNYIESFPRFLERGYEPEKFFLNLHTNPTNLINEPNQTIPIQSVQLNPSKSTATAVRPVDQRLS